MRHLRWHEWLQLMVSTRSLSRLVLKAGRMGFPPALSGREQL